MALLLLLQSTALAAALPEHLLLADIGLHVVGVGYQHTIGPRLAAQVALEAYTPWTQNIDLLGLSGAAATGDTNGAVVRARAYVYPFGAAPTGLWVSPFAQAGVGWATRDEQREAGPLWAAGASVGYAGLVGRHFHLTFGLGAQYHTATYPGGAGSPSFSRFYPTLDGSVGYAF
ncbi:MAG: hypothetical protein Q8P18_20985 [Pseudomonadota bacterium]|nr:hypothetical protein [Pseudomonadota bacterium]